MAVHVHLCLHFINALRMTNLRNHIKKPIFMKLVVRFERVALASDHWLYM